MDKAAKLIGSLGVLGIWGPYLLYVWANPSQIPSWTYLPGMHKVLMLDRLTHEPTVFTLMFGLVFTGLVLYGLVKIAVAKVDLAD